MWDPTQRTAPFLPVVWSRPRGGAPTFDSLATDLRTTRAGTESIHDVTRVLNQRLGGDRYHSVEIPDRRATPEQIERLRTDVVDAISAGDPVVANIVGQVRDNAGDVHRYAGGHYVTITGYADDGRTVTVTDPVPFGSEIGDPTTDADPFTPTVAV